MGRLNIIDPNASFEDFRKESIENFQTIQRIFDSFAINILKSMSSTTAQAVTSTSFVKVNDLQAGVRTSGGVIDVFCRIGATVPNSQTAAFQLLVDDKVQSITSFVNTGGDTRTTPILKWRGALESGQHTFKIQAKVTGGTLTLAETSEAPLTMDITEFMRG